MLDGPNFCGLSEYLSFLSPELCLFAKHNHFFPVLTFIQKSKGQIISKGLLISSNSPKKQTTEFIFSTTMNLFVRILGEFEDTKKPFGNYLTFKKEYGTVKTFSKIYIYNFDRDILIY